MTQGKVKGIISNLLTISVDGPVAQNEICYVRLGDLRLMAEVIKVIGENVYAQVFESTRGLRVGDTVEFTGHMLEVTLGPGLLSKNFDGLENDLDKLSGVFLQRGEYNFPLDKEKLWDFKPIAKPGDKVRAADWLGEVDETTSHTKSWCLLSWKANIPLNRWCRRANTQSWTPSPSSLTARATTTKSTWCRSGP